jgi:hypothetical protein
MINIPEFTLFSKYTTMQHGNNFIKNVTIHSENIRKYSIPVGNKKILRLDNFVMFLPLSALKIT